VVACAPPRLRRPELRPARALGAAVLGDRPDVRRLRALLPLARLELDLRAFGEALEALAGDFAVVYEEVFPAVVGRDEAVPLVVAEPLTGAREGELFALKADDVDFPDDTLLVVTTGSNRRGQTKTRGSKRTIDLPPLAAQLLREQQLARWHTASRLVFPAPEGGIWNKDNFTARVFRPAVGRAAEKYRREHQLRDEESTPFDGLTFHDLRHTCASLMIAAANQAGAGQAVTIKSIAEQLGHTDGGVLVLRRYGHLFKGTRRHAALALDEYVRAGEPGAERSATHAK
jgi:integrase